jgi:homoserine dehydrogenase
MSRRPLRALLLGFGNIGRKLAELLPDRAAHPGLVGLEVAAIGIVTGRHGALARPAGIDLAAAAAHLRAHGDFAGHADAVVLDSPTAVATLDYDVVVDTTPLSVSGRGEPTLGWLRAALQRGRHVVTCNKGPIAWGYRELAEAARRGGVGLFFETTVMDGAPLFALARAGLRGSRIGRLEGILNSTTNFVLGRLEQGAGLDDAVRAAQQAGMAEADPTLDLDGWDAAVKLAVLVNVLMDVPLEPESIARASLREVDPARVGTAAAAGRRLKLVARAERRADGVLAEVALREVPATDPFALVEGSGAALRITGDILGTIVLTQEAPDLSATAFGVIADLFAVQSLLQGDRC